MKKTVRFLIGISLIILIAGLSGCNKTAGNSNSDNNNGTDQTKTNSVISPTPVITTNPENNITHEVNKEVTPTKKPENNTDNFTKDGRLKPEIAKKEIFTTSEKAIKALKDKDMSTLSELTHPLKGIRFSPYTYVDTQKDLVFTKEQIKNFLNDKKEYIWGIHDGSGEDIKLTTELYYKEYIYSKDFISAEEIGYNTILSSGNTVNNQFEVYDNPIIVEYFFSGFDPQYEGLDWQSLHLVFEEYDGNWYLVGIIHSQMTI